jgi:PAS domain S-box-containing protein
VRKNVALRHESLIYSRSLISNSYTWISKTTSNHYPTIIQIYGGTYPERSHVYLLPAFKKIMPLGQAIYKSTSEISTLFSKMNEFNPNCFKPLIMYAVFLKNLLQDEAAAFEISSSIRIKINYMVLNKKLSDELECKYGANSSSAVAIISGTLETSGKIINANQEIYSTLGYNRSDIIGRNISMLMPSIIGELHARCIVQGIQSHSQGRAMLIFALHQNGTIRPCRLMYKVLTFIKDGVKLIGFINIEANISELCNKSDKMLSNEALLFIADQEFHLIGFSMYTLQYLDISVTQLDIAKYHCSQQKIDLKSVFHQLFDKKDITAMYSLDGSACNLDLLSLKQHIIRETYEQLNSVALPTSTKESSLSRDNLLKSTQVIARCKSFSLLGVENSFYVMSLAFQIDEQTKGEISLLPMESMKNNINELNLKVVNNDIEYDEKGSVTTTSSGMIAN